MTESRRFHLNRVEDLTGISGEGIVAHGVQFPDGSCAMRWATDITSTAIYNSIEDVVFIHGHEERTKVVWDD